MMIFIYILILFITLISAETVDFYIDFSESDIPNEQYPSVVINGSWNDWSGWGVELIDDDNDGIFTGSLNLSNGDYQYVIAGTGSSDNWSGWGEVIYAPLESTCDFLPNDEWQNYGFTINNANIEQYYCAGTCDSQCNSIQLDCEDPQACNFLSSGECLYNIDCFGDCGGNAIEDECGICNGEGIPEGYCDCEALVVGCSDTWGLIWADEFNDSNINEDKWNFEIGTGGWGWGNGEYQYYTSRPENAFIQNGKLIINALNENYQGSSYTSARMTSKNKGDFLYGKIKARIKVPSAGGTWPAFWLLPTQSVYGGWPASGEIDIMEHYGCDNMNENNPFSTVHNNIYNWNGGAPPTSYAQYIPTATTDFHVYEMIWSEDKIDFYIDEQYSGTYFKTSDSWQQWPYDQEYFIILNLAIGSHYMACDVEDDLFPQQLEIDYVRVFQFGSFCSLSGDVNNDLTVNVADIVELVNVIINSLDVSLNSCYDVNQDSLVNVVDIISIVDIIINP